MSLMVGILVLLGILWPAVAMGQDRPLLKGCYYPPGVGRPAICEKSCATWARGQPDYRLSYDACITTCRKIHPCVRPPQL
jgi:hypothetical protein